MDLLMFSVLFCALAACRALESHLSSCCTNGGICVFSHVLTSMWAVGCKNQRGPLEPCGPAFPRTSPGDTNFER